MNEKVLSQIRELDAAAEKAGGYVMPPDQVKVNRKSAQEFTTMRQYSIRHKKPISKFTDADYRAIGLTQTYAAMDAAEKGEDMYGPFNSVADLMEALNT